MPRRARQPTLLWLVPQCNHAEQIKAPVLLLHGAADERIPVQQTEAFAAKLKATGVRYRIKIYPETPHGIPIDDQYCEVFPFLDEFLR